MPTPRQYLSHCWRRLKLLGRNDPGAEVQRLFWLLQEPKYRPGTLHWRGQSLRYADGPALYYQLNDIAVERAYDFSCPQADPRILDVGAHIGLASLRLRTLFPAARITAFEPDPALLQLLRANLVAGGDDRTQVIAAAAWKADGVARFAATGDDSGGLSPDGSIEVPTVDLARLCLEGDAVEFLKLDVEGAEFDVIEHLRAQGALARVRRIFIEMHQWGGNTPRFHEIMATLAGCGFNYRIRSAGTLGSARQPGGFTSLSHPANLASLYAWQAGLDDKASP